jgi:hypothetical protein
LVQMSVAVTGVMVAVANLPTNSALLTDTKLPPI